MDSNTEFTKEHKLAYLRDAIKDPSIKSLLFSGTVRDDLYEEVVALLHQRFDKRRVIHANYCHTLTELSSVKANKTDLHQFVDTVKHALSGLRHTGQYDLPSFLTSMLAPCLPKPLQVEWEVHSRDSKCVPPVEEFLEFVAFRADVPPQRPRTHLRVHLTADLITHLRDTELQSTPPHLGTQPTDPTTYSGMSASCVQAVSTLCFSAQCLTR